MLIHNKPLILSISTFIVLVLLYAAVSSMLTGWRNQRSLLNRTRKWSGEAEHPQDPDIVEPGDQASGSRRRFGLPGGRAQGGETGIYANTPLFYQRAGIYNPGSIRTWQFIRYALLVAPVSLPLVAYFIYHRPVDAVMILLVFLIGYIGYCLPVLWLRVAAHYRKKELNRTFPDALDLLMVCVEAGMGLDAAIRRVSREIHLTSPELSKELKILSLELKTGMTRNACLKNLAQRADLPDVDNLVSLLIQAEKYGTGVANALKVHAEEMRQKRYSRLEEMAAKLPVKLVVPMMLFIFPALFVIIAGPAAIQVLRVLIQG